MATKKSNKKKNRQPKLVFEQIEDYYTYYVLIMGVSEDIFWNSDISFLLTVLDNKCAYDDYLSYLREKEIEKRNR
jgi:hypothetical protein